MSRSAVAVLALVLGSASPALAVPRLMQSPADYFLMPFLGYLSIVALAQLVARLRRNQG